jgi:hypothetical protein
MGNKKTNVNITFGDICGHLIKCVIKKHIQILFMDTYVSIWLKDYLKSELMKWTLLDNFGHFSSHIWTLLRYMFPLITCVINKQMLILLLDTYVSILLKYYLKIELRIKKWTLLDTLKHIWTLFRYMCPFN